MTLLMVVCTPTQAVILTDTNAIATKGRAPVHHITKTLTLPHLEMVVAGGGDHATFVEWSQRMLRSRARDIDELDAAAPTLAGEVIGRREEYHHAMGRQGLLISQFVHVGYSPTFQQYVGYRYLRYRNDDGTFKQVVSEPLARSGSWFVEPGQTDDVRAQFGELVSTYMRDNDLGALVRIALETKRLDDTRDPDESVHIGGRLIMTVMADHRTSSACVHDFDA